MTEQDVARSTQHHSPAEILGTDGRPLGLKALDTRRKLLVATREALEAHGMANLRVVDIARRAGASGATFYQYFADARDALCHLAIEVNEGLGDLAPPLAGDWGGSDGLSLATTFVERFLDFWDENRSVLTARNLAVEEGDPEFGAIRRAALTPILNRIASQIAAGQKVGRVAHDLDPLTSAIALISMVERMAAHHVEMEEMGIGRRQFVTTLARLLHDVVAGPTR